MLGVSKVEFEPGLSFVGFLITNVERYPDVITVGYGNDEELLDDITSSNPPLLIKFNDAAPAMVTAYTKWVLPSNEDQMKKLHRQFHSATKLAETSLTPYTTECLKYASQMMESTRLS
jgi:hypothetical protein